MYKMMGSLAADLGFDVTPLERPASACLRASLHANLPSLFDEHLLVSGALVALQTHHPVFSL